MNEVVAIVLEPRGTARVRSGDGTSMAMWRVGMLDGIEAGTWLDLEAGATVTLLCQDGSVLELEESGVVDARRCGEGAVKTKRRFAGMLPGRGRLRAWKGNWALEGGTRIGPTAYGTRPVILSPRCPLDKSSALGCSRLLSAPAQIRWSAVQRAKSYILRWNGRQEVQVEPGACVLASAGSPGSTCSVPWPEAWTLAAGVGATLDIEARLGLFEAVGSQTTRLEGVPTREATAIRNRLDRVTALGLADVATDLLSVSVYAEAGLLIETVAAIERAAREASEPQIVLALADGYRRLDLSVPAMRQYEVVLATVGEAGTKGAERAELVAAAHLGLAWVHFQWDHREQAEARALAAESLLVRLGEADSFLRPRLAVDLAEVRALLAGIRERDAAEAGDSGEESP